LNWIFDCQCHNVNFCDNLGILTKGLKWDSRRHRHELVHILPQLLPGSRVVWTRWNPSQYPSHQGFTWLPQQTSWVMWEYYSWYYLDKMLSWFPHYNCISVIKIAVNIRQILRSKINQIQFQLGSLHLSPDPYLDLRGHTSKGGEGPEVRWQGREVEGGRMGRLIDKLYYRGKLLGPAWFN